jgi:hypothetical protein
VPNRYILPVKANTGRGYQMDIRKRLFTKFNFTAIGIFFLTTFIPILLEKFKLINETVQWVIIIGGIICGIIFIVVGQLKAKNHTPIIKELGLHDIIPTLQNTDLLLLDLAHKESGKYFNYIRYELAINELNSYLGLTPDKFENPYDLEEAKLATLNVESSLQNKFKDYKDIDYYNGFVKLKDISAFWDRKKLGLKKVRMKNKEYKTYKATVDMLKNTYPDEELGECIIDHIEFSEAFANNILAKDRALQIGALMDWKIYTFDNLASVETQIKVEEIDANMAKFLSEIRFTIGQRIDELEKHTKEKTI